MTDIFIHLFDFLPEWMLQGFFIVACVLFCMYAHSKLKRQEPTDELLHLTKTICNDLIKLTDSMSGLADSFTRLASIYNTDRERTHEHYKDTRKIMANIMDIKNGLQTTKEHLQEIKRKGDL